MASVSSFKDSLQNNVISADWSKSLGADPNQVNCINDRLEITHSAAAQYNSLHTAVNYDLTGDFFYVRILDRGNQTLASHEVQVATYVDGSNNTWMTMSNNQLSTYKLVAGVQAQVGASITYNPSLHRFLRVREAAGTMFYETSPDAAVGNWVTQWTLANPFAITSISPTLICGCYAAEAVGSFGYFDQFNFGRINAIPSRPYFSVGDGMGRSEM